MGAVCHCFGRSSAFCKVHTASFPRSAWERTRRSIRPRSHTLRGNALAGCSASLKRKLNSPEGRPGGRTQSVRDLRYDAERRNELFLPVSHMPTTSVGMAPDVRIGRCPGGRTQSVRDLRYDAERRHELGVVTSFAACSPACERLRTAGASGPGVAGKCLAERGRGHPERFCQGVVIGHPVHLGNLDLISRDDRHLLCQLRH